MATRVKKTINERERIAKQIALTSESIRKKHRALKTGQIEEEVILAKRLKPIVEPLTEIVGNTQLSKNYKETTDPLISIKKKYEELDDKILQNEQKEQMEQMEQQKEKTKVSHLKLPNVSTSFSSKVRSAPPDSEQSFFTEDEAEFSRSAPLEPRRNSFAGEEEMFENVETIDSPIQYVLQSPKTREVLLNQLGPLGRKHVGALLSNDKMTDNVYGVFYDRNRMMLGDKQFDVDKDDNIIINGVLHTGTPGLYELIFRRLPTEGSYTKKDLQTYRKILLLTNAYRRGRNSRLPVMGNKGYKYKKIIGPLISHLIGEKSGSGHIPHAMTVSDDKIEYVHWDDPNELVERLRLLEASRTAGNNAHDNEFMSIIEELREVGLIIN